MKFRRFLIAPLAAAALLLSTGSLYSAPVFCSNHHEQSAQPEKPAEFHYICPMHEDVKARKPGKCPKCKMKLEKKRIKPPQAKPSDQ